MDPAPEPTQTLAVLTGCAVCVSGPCRKPGGAGGCLAYALCMLRCYSSPRKARAALDGAGEWVLAKRTSAETVYDPQSVFCPGQTWCPEAIQVALQKRRFSISKVRDWVQAQAILKDKKVKGSFLVEGTLAQEYWRNVGGKATLHVNDPEDDHAGPNDPVWCHTVALSDNGLFDRYNPRGIVKTHLTQDEKPYFMRIKTVWRITPFGMV